jgi:hypothetical protein
MTYRYDNNNNNETQFIYLFLFSYPFLILYSLSPDFTITHLPLTLLFLPVSHWFMVVLFLEIFPPTVGKSKYSHSPPEKSNFLGKIPAI